MSDRTAKPEGHPPRQRSWRKRRDWGQLLARLVCVVFALIGLAPLLVGAVVRIDSVQQRASEYTANLIANELGIVARYELEVSPWPVEVGLEHLVVEASDGGSPVLSARRVVARPRLFYLLAGKPDLGQVNIEEPRVRLIIRDGAFANLRLDLPEPSADESPPGQPPLSAVSITSGYFDITIDQLRVRADDVDVDVALEDGPVAEVALRAGTILVDHRHADPAHPSEEMMDEDIVCRLAARARISAEQLLVRRLTMLGVADLDAANGTRPSCEVGPNAWAYLKLEANGVEAWLHDGQLSTLDGRLSLRAPAAIAHRFVDMPPITGWVGLDVERLHFDADRKLPQLRGRLTADALGLDSKFFSHDVSAALELRDETVIVQDLKTRWAGARVAIAEATVQPFAPGLPLAVKDVRIRGATLPDLMDELAGHPRAWVALLLAKVDFEAFGGTLDPLAIEGALVADTRDFGIYDRPTVDKNKRPYIELSAGALTGVLAITPDAAELRNMQLVTRRSRVNVSVSIGFDETLGIQVREGSVVDLADISPLVDIPVAGRATLSALGTGTFGDPQIQGELKVDNFEFGGFVIGDVERAEVRFEPMRVDLTNAVVTHGSSGVDIPRFSVDFEDGDAGVVVKTDIDTRRAGLTLSDFFSIIGRADDPRFASLKAVGRGQAQVSYVLGGRRDTCGGGKLLVRSQMHLSRVDLFSEPFDGGEVDFRLLWDDFDAGDRGMKIDVYSAVLHKGGGDVVASATVRHGALLHADVVGSGVSLMSLRSLAEQFVDSGDAARVRPEAEASFVAVIGGTLTRLEGIVDIHLTPMRLGPDLLPASDFRLDIVPTSKRLPPVRPGARCPGGTSKPFDMAEYRRDRSDGLYRLSGGLFANQVRFDELEITQQRAKRMRGGITLDKLDIGKVANLAPGIAFSANPPRGHVSATIDITDMSVDKPSAASARITLNGLDVKRGAQRFMMGKVASPLVIKDDAVTVPNLPLTIELGEGLRTTVSLGGSVTNISSPSPRLDMRLKLTPVQLSELGIELPRVQRASGLLAADVTIKGTTSLPQLAGSITLKKGSLKVAGFPSTIDDIDVDLRVRDGEIELKRVAARIGNRGRISISGRIPLRGLDIAGVDATLVAREVQLPVADGVRMTADATLSANYRVAVAGQPQALPQVTGTVSLTQFSYTRPMALSLDLEALTGRGPTSVETYNPADDFLRFDVRVVSPRPLRISNNLVDMRMDVAGDGLRLSGTNQRFGARGSLRIQSDSQLFLQGHDFTIGDGRITFDDPMRIAGRLDVRATTEYRRQAFNASSSDDTTVTDATTGGANSGSANSSGSWRITMHAHGDIDAPSISFTSDPSLSQEDILLLLQLGMTRAELDSGLATTLAQTLGLEALSAVTGFDRVLKKTLPLFDEIRVLSQYSSRTGRPEPTLLVGKRISDQVRATVTTGLSQNQEIRANVEWRLSSGVSVQGSYDNVNDITSSAFGNLGVNLRWRLEMD